ncbi:MAG: acylphosphatase [Gemmatimonadota bacterium]
MTTSAKRFLIHGRVQGVGFRWWTSRQARRLGIEGTVRNREDGTVEVQAVGPQDAMDSFAAALGNGPAPARVERVEAESLASPPRVDGFQILA